MGRSKRTKAPKTLVHIQHPGDPLSNLTNKKLFLESGDYLDAHDYSEAMKEILGVPSMKGIIALLDLDSPKHHPAYAKLSPPKRDAVIELHASINMLALTVERLNNGIAALDDDVDRIMVKVEELSRPFPKGKMFVSARPFKTI